MISPICHLHDPVVEQQDDEAGYVEGGDGGVDDEVCVVQLALCLLRVRAGVVAHDDGQAEQGGDGPDEADGAEDARVVVGLLLLRVLHGGGDGLVAVDADGNQVEDGGGRAHHVHRDVGVAQHERQRPKLEHLEKKEEEKWFTSYFKCP